jgi:hypothetical protein
MATNEMRNVRRDPMGKAPAGSVAVLYEDERGATRETLLTHDEFANARAAEEDRIRARDAIHPAVQVQRDLAGEARTVGLDLADVEALTAAVGVDRARELVRSHGPHARLQAVAETVYARRRVAMAGG